MEEPYGTIDGVNMLVRALSEMAKPCGYFVQADLDLLTWDILTKVLWPQLLK